MYAHCKHCNEIVEPTGVLDVWQSINSLVVVCPIGPADHVGDRDREVPFHKLP